MKLNAFQGTTVKPDSMLEINGKKVGHDLPTYFIADIAANHDGDIGRAKELIYLAAESLRQ